MGHASKPDSITVYVVIFAVCIFHGQANDQNFRVLKFHR